MNFLTYVFVSTLLISTVFGYWDNEENLLHTLKDVMMQRQTLLQKSTRYLAGIIEVRNITSKTYMCFKHTREISRGLWTSIEYLKRVVVDWENFLKYLFTWPNAARQFLGDLLKHDDGYLTDYIIYDNDYKLINFAKRIMKTKRIEHKNAAIRKLHIERVVHTVQKFKNSMVNFMQTVDFIQPTILDSESVYSQLCRGEVEPNYSTLFLKCWHFHNNSPYLIIGPFKVEELHSDPPVYFYHDVLTDSEIKAIKERALKQQMYISQATETSYRVAKVTWLAKNETESVSRRTSLMTNLNMKYSEDLQFSAYGISGHYEPHLDAAENHMDNTSSRISTVLFYLNDNLQGGATVFPRLNLAVSPKKGGAVVWHNLKSDYEVADVTLHASCPLYSGVKWVLNSWIHTTGQEFRVPCDAKRIDGFMIGKAHPPEI